MTTLEKIRAEIVEKWKDEPCAKEYGCLDEVLEIIDKYAEQEPKTNKVMMRDATPGEQKSVNNYIKSISKPTGVKFEGTNMACMGGDEIMKEFENNVQEPCCKVEMDENGYAHVSPIKHCEDG